MRVLGAVSLGGAGHLGPLRPVLDAAVRRGDETLVIGPPAMRAMVEGTGHPFAAGGEPPESAIAPIREQLPVADPVEASVLANRELFGRLATRAMLPAMRRVVDEWAPQVVVRDPCEYASAVVAAERGITTVQTAISLAEAEWGSIAVAAPALEEHRHGLTDVVRATAYLTRFPAALDPSPFPNTIRVREPVPTSGRVLPDWWPGDQRPLVYVTFGTVLAHMERAVDVLRVAVDAVQDLDTRVLLTVGPACDPAALGDVPEHVHVERWVDQVDVLGEAELVVCHGGSGTTFAALAAGVPIVIVPQFADQFLNGERVVAAGAGLTVEPRLDDRGLRQPLGAGDAPRIAAAVDRVRREPGFRQAAEAIARSMEAAPTVDEVIEVLASPTPQG